jgi:hypothetical protein
VRGEVHRAVSIAEARPRRRRRADPP